VISPNSDSVALGKELVKLVLSDPSKEMHVSDVVRVIVNNQSGRYVSSFSLILQRPRILIDAIAGCTLHCQ
jgi:hypothetical protein